MLINSDPQSRIETAKMFHELERKGRNPEEFDHAKDGHKLVAGTHAFIEGKPVTIVHDDGIWIDWVPGHVDQHTTNFRGLITLEP